MPIATTSWEVLLQDIRFGVRVLRRNRGFTFTTVVLLALGIGANTAIFSVVSSVFLQPLPFPDPGRLVLLWDDFTARGGPARVEASLPDYVEWKARSRSFDDMAVLVPGNFNLTGTGEPERLSGIRTTANLFSVLGMPAVVGRTLTPGDEAPGADAAVVIREDYWRRRFGGDPGIVGRTITLNGMAHTVVGVVPASLRFPADDAVLWVPARFTPQELSQRFAYFAYVVARLRPDVALPQARLEMSAVALQLAAEFPNGNTQVGITVSELHEHVPREVDVDPEPEVYIPAAQMGASGPFLWPQYLVVRTAAPSLSVATAVRQAVWAVDPNQPVANVRTMDEVFDAELLSRNTQLSMVGAFAVLALAIAVVGLYGLLAYGVSQRQRDIGVRMALGARREQVVAEIAQQSLTLVGLAMAFGFAGAFAVTRLLRTWLFDVSATDPLTFAVTAVALVIAALAACVIPALRAASVHPAVVLRAE